MYTAIVTIPLGLFLTFFSPSVSDAAIWVCPQQGQGLLYTDEPQTGESCKKYEIVSQLNYAPPQILPDPYSPEMTPEKTPAKDPEVLAESSSEETHQAALDSRRKNNTEPNSLWGFDETPTLAGVYSYIYTYVPRFYGSPFPRHKDSRDLSNGPWRHEAKDGGKRDMHPNKPEMKHNASVQPHPAPATASTPRHENSVRAIVPALARSAPPMPSIHAQGSSVRSTVAGPANQIAPPILPAPVRGIAPAAAASTSASQIMNDPPQRPSGRRFMPVEPRSQ
jgi:hypothetical protein